MNAHAEYEMPPNRAIQQRMLCGRDIHIPKGVYCLLVSDRMKVSSFQVTKTNANKRFLLCLQTDCSDCVAKVVKYFGLSKRNCILVRFSLEQISKQFQEMCQLF